MANYNKGGEIFIDLGGVNVETPSTTDTNNFTVSGIFSRLEKAHNLGKSIVITNYVSKYASYPTQLGVPTSVTLYRPTGSAFYIPVLSYSGISIILIKSTNVVSVYKVYAYSTVTPPPETTTNNARSIEETIEETEKGEESK